MSAVAKRVEQDVVSVEGESCSNISSHTRCDTIFHAEKGAPWNTLRIEAELSDRERQFPACKLTVVTVLSEGIYKFSDAQNCSF